jgi:uncharacterized protein (TIGR03083 family)
VTTPAYAELVSAVRREAESMLAAGRQDLDRSVPTCDGWTVDDLFRHVAGVFTFVSTIVHERATSRPEQVELPASETSSDVLAHALEELVDGLRSCDADTPMWNWSSQPDDAAFWARRMAHEAAVHRFDAQRSFDVAQPVDADLARDGLDELVDVILPRVVARDRPSLPVGTFLFASGDDELWQVQVDDDGVRRLDALKEPDVTVRGTTSALLLAAYSRVPWSSLELSGDTTLLDGWSKAFSF